MRFNEVNERFYNRLDFIFGFLALAGGSAGVVAFVNRSPDVAGAAGVILSAGAILARLIGASRKVEQHANAKRA